MTIIALDQSLRSTGVSILKDGWLSFKLLGAPQSVTNIVKQIKYVTYQVQEIVLQSQADVVVIEDLPYGLNSTTVRPLAALYFNILMFGEYWGIPVETISITTAKKAAGKGTLKKAEMFEALPKRVANQIKRVTNRKKAQLDLSDSYWILQAYLQKD